MVPKYKSMPLIKKSVVINLDRATERLRKALGELDRLSVPGPIVRFPAINGNAKLDDPSVERLIKGVRGGTRGCAASHRTLWKEAAAEPGWTLIFEDDVMGPNSDTNLSSRITDGLTEAERLGADLLYFGRCLDCCGAMRPTGMAGVYTTKGPLCTHAYAVTELGAQKLLRRAARTTVGIVDMFLRDAIRDQTIKALTFHPGLLVPDMRSPSGIRHMAHAWPQTVECHEAYTSLLTATLDVIKRPWVFGLICVGLALIIGIPLLIRYHDRSNSLYPPKL